MYTILVKLIFLILSEKTIGFAVIENFVVYMDHRLKKIPCKQTPIFWL